MTEPSGNGPRWQLIAQVFGALLMMVCAWFLKDIREQSQANGAQIAKALTEIAEIKVNLTVNGREHESFITRDEVRYLVATDTINRLSRLTGQIPERNHDR